MLESRRARAAARSAGGLIPLISAGRVVADGSHTTVAALQAPNEMGKSDLIMTGQKLVTASERATDRLAMLPADPPCDPQLEAWARYWR